MVNNNKYMMVCVSHLQHHLGWQLLRLDPSWFSFLFLFFFKKQLVFLQSRSLLFSLTVSLFTKVIE